MLSAERGTVLPWGGLTRQLRGGPAIEQRVRAVPTGPSELAPLQRSSAERLTGPTAEYSPVLVVRYDDDPARAHRRDRELDAREPCATATVALCCNAAQCHRAGWRDTVRPAPSAPHRTAHWAAAGSKRLPVTLRHAPWRARARARTDERPRRTRPSAITPLRASLAERHARRGQAGHTGGGRGGRRAQPHRDQFLANNGVHVLSLQPPHCFGRGAV